MILDASGATDALTDEEARPLMEWALSQGEAAAKSLWAAGELAPLPASKSHAMLAAGVAPVRRAMRAINALAGGRRDMTPDEVFAELEGLRATAEELPLPPSEAVTSTALAELSAWQSRLDTRTFVRAILYLLRPAPAAETRVE